MQYENDEMEIDLREIFFVLKQKAVVIILVSLIFALTSGLISFFVIDPMYSATSKIFILTKSTSITSLADIQMGNSLTADYMELVKSRPVVETVIDDLNLDVKYEKLVEQVNVSNTADTRVLNITIEDKDPNMAKAIAEDFSKVSRKQISDIMKTDEPTIVEDAVVPEEPISPNKVMNVVIGFLLGFILSAFTFIVLHMLDDTIKSQEDVEKYLGLNTLTVIPLKEGTVKGKRRKLTEKKKKGGNKHA